LTRLVDEVPEFAADGAKKTAHGARLRGSVDLWFRDT
jgi:hypothetical protein